MNEAIELANASSYGPGFSIYTAVLPIAMRTAPSCARAPAWINDPLKDIDASPSSRKMSGRQGELGILSTVAAARVA